MQCTPFWQLDMDSLENWVQVFGGIAAGGSTEAADTSKLYFALLLLPCRGFLERSQNQ